MYKIADVEIDEGQALCCLRPESLAIHVGDACVVQCERVQEYGRVTRLAELDGNPPSERMLPEVLRCATLQDQAKAEDNALRSRMAVDTVAAGVEKHKLEMRLIRVRYSFDRALLRVTFSAEGRVDFRELIKDLAAELQTRIDMRQIGVRDEAGILGGVASCGRRLCCCTWLRNFEPVNVKMAKIQRLSLNPGAISGMCGRLKCCLRYENDLYKELSRHVPPEGCTVQCPDGNGRVVGCDVLRQQVQVRLEDERTVTCGVDEVKRANGK